MRLFLLPISTRRALIYCEPLAQVVPTAQQSYLDRIVNKANQTWLDWEKDSKAPLNWKQRTTNAGNLLFRRIPFEEWGLKTIPPLGKGESAPSAAEDKYVAGVKSSLKGRVDVEFPGLYENLCTRPMQDALKRIATERQGLHRRRMWGSLVGMPISAPVALLPVIPNLPFFYLLFRFYSHWKALSGSKHLEHLIQNDRIRMVPSPTLDTLYTAGLLHPSRDKSRGAAEPSMAQSRAVVAQLKKQTVPVASGSASSTASTVSTESDEKAQSTSAATASKPPDTDADEEVMLLRAWNAKVIAERLGLPGLEVEIERAVEQVEKSIGKSAEELARERREIEALAHRAESAAAATKTKTTTAKGPAAAKL